MAVTGTQTVRTIVTDALEKINVVDAESTPEAYEVAKGVRELNRMLKGWQNKGYSLFNYASQTVTLTTAASYTMSPVRPIRLLGVRYNNGSTEIPMTEMTRQEYDDLPVKTTTGTPTQFYYDKQRESALIYIWPVLSAASGQTLEVTYEAEFEDITDEDDVLPLPGEYWDAVVYNLADRLADDFGVDAPKVMMRAEKLLNEALAADTEGSVFFMGDEVGYR